MENIHKIVIFGATGNTGLCCLQSAVDLGFAVTAFVRDESKIPDNLKDEINIVTGDATNANDVDEAVQGQDAVVIALGTGVDLSPTTLFSEGIKNALEAMTKYNIRRISACLSAFLFREPCDVPERFYELNEDHKRMLDALKNSDRDWIAVLPPHIADTAATGCPVITHGAMGPSKIVSKHDLGKFLIDCLKSDEHLHELCGICNEAQEHNNELYHQ